MFHWQYYSVWQYYTVYLELLPYSHPYDRTSIFLYCNPYSDFAVVSTLQKSTSFCMNAWMLCTWLYTMGSVTAQDNTDTVANATEAKAQRRRERRRLRSDGTATHFLAADTSASHMPTRAAAFDAVGWCGGNAGGCGTYGGAIDPIKNKKNRKTPNFGKD